MSIVYRAMFIASLLFVAGCGTLASKPESTTPSTTALDRTMTMAGMVGEKQAFEMTVDTGFGPLYGTYSFIKDKKKHEVNSFFDEENPGSLTVDEFNELYPNETRDSKFEFTEKAPGRYEGSFVQTEGATKQPAVMEEVDNNSSEQQTYGGHFKNGETYLDILFIGKDLVKLQGLAVNASRNNWELGTTLPVIAEDGGYHAQYGEGECAVEFALRKNTITAHSGSNCQGGNVTFEGDYSRESTRVPNWNIFNDVVARH